MSDVHPPAINSAPASWDKQQNLHGASFLQSSLWGDFQKALGHQPHYLSGEGWSCLLIERSTPFGRYLFAPYGPTLSEAHGLDQALEALKSYSSQAGFDWLIIEPMRAGGSHSLRPKLSQLGARPSSHLREPDMTRVLDLSRNQEDILASISQSTRSYIRKNQRENFISFKSSTDPQDIEFFIEMLAAVSKRNQVYFFPPDYFRTQAKLLMPGGMLHLELAYQDSRPIASGLFHDYGQTTSYTFGGSLPEARQHSASALLVWQAILNAQARGQTKMDLFGIAPDDASASHPWYGFSSFKKKFGGEVVTYAGTWDIALTYKYRLYRAAQNLRQRLR